MSFTYSFYRVRDGVKPESFAYRSALVGKDHWMWLLEATEGASIEGYGYPTRITAKAMFVIPHLLADFDANTGFGQFEIYRDLTDFDDDELIEIEAWDQN